jgi:hypothetical protein
MSADRSDTQADAATSSHEVRERSSGNRKKGHHAKLPLYVLVKSAFYLGSLTQKVTETAVLDKNGTSTVRFAKNDRRIISKRVCMNDPHRNRGGYHGGKIEKRKWTERKKPCGT